MPVGNDDVDRLVRHGAKTEQAPRGHVREYASFFEMKIDGLAPEQE